MDDNITKMKIIPVKPVAIEVPAYPVPELVDPPAGKSMFKSKTFWGAMLGAVGAALELAEPYVDQVPLGKTGSFLLKTGFMLAVWGIRAANSRII